MNRIGIRVQDLFDANDPPDRRWRRALEQKNHLLVKVYNRRALDPVQITEHLLSHADRIAPHVADVSRVVNDALDATRSCSSRAPRPTISTSITAPTPTSPPPTRSPPGPASAPASARPGSIASSGSSRPTPRGWARGRCPPNCVDDDGERLRTVGGGVRHHDRSEATLWLVRRPGGRSGRPGQRLHRHLLDQAGHPGRVGADPDLRWLRRARRSPRQPCRSPRPTSTTPGRSTRRWTGWEDDISECRDFADLPKATQLYVQRLEELCRTRISGIGVGPERDQSIVINDLI